MATDYQMPRPGKVCSACERAFEVEERFRACLYEIDEGYERRDYCARCAVPDAPAPVGSWTSRRPAPAARKVQPFDREAIFNFFRRLEDPDTPEKVQFRFVLALLLWRKKVLKLDRSTQEDEREFWEFGMKATGESHRVERPILAEDELERLSGQLEHLLSGQPGELEALTPDTSKETADG